MHGITEPTVIPSCERWIMHRWWALSMSIGVTVIAGRCNTHTVSPICTARLLVRTQKTMSIYEQHQYTNKKKLLSHVRRMCSARIQRDGKVANLHKWLLLCAAAHHGWWCGGISFFFISDFDKYGTWADGIDMRKLFFFSSYLSWFFSGVWSEFGKTTAKKKWYAVVIQPEGWRYAYVMCVQMKTL